MVPDAGEAGLHRSTARAPSRPSLAIEDEIRRPPLDDDPGQRALEAGPPPVTAIASVSADQPLEARRIVAAADRQQQAHQRRAPHLRRRRDEDRSPSSRADGERVDARPPRRSARRPRRRSHRPHRRAGGAVAASRAGVEPFAGRAAAAAAAPAPGRSAGRRSWGRRPARGRRPQRSRRAGRAARRGTAAR